MGFCLPSLAILASRAQHLRPLAVDSAVDLVWKKRALLETGLKLKIVLKPVHVFCHRSVDLMEKHTTTDVSYKWLTVTLTTPLQRNTKENVQIKNVVLWTRMVIWKLPASS